MTSWNEFLSLSERARVEQPPDLDVSGQVLEAILQSDEVERVPPWQSLLIRGTFAGAVAVSATLLLVAQPALQALSDPLVAWSEATTSLVNP